MDVGCAKGFFLYDLKQELPGISINGVDISEYAIKNAKPEVKEYLQVANATKLPFKDDSFEKSFDIVIEKIAIYDALSICYVTSDSGDFTKNRVFLSYQDIYNDKKYEILRESNFSILLSIIL